MLKVVSSLYRKLPLWLRDRLRWIRHPRWSLVSTWIYYLAKGKVVSGPFAGMIIADPRPHLPYLLGTQELELHEHIERLIALKLDRIVNVGAADGYYAVGLARRCPKIRVIAFEAQSSLHELLRRSAALNGVSEQLDVRGTCSRTNLESILAGGGQTLIVIDIEGGEMDVLDPAATPGLRNALILVETHDILREGCSEAMAKRFAETHIVERFVSRRRLRSDMPLASIRAIGTVMPGLVAATMFEQRLGEQDFFLMIPRSAPGSAPGTNSGSNPGNALTAAPIR